MSSANIPAPLVPSIEVQWDPSRRYAEVGFAVSNPTVKYQVDEEGGETKTLVRHGGPGDSSTNDPMA